MSEEQVEVQKKKKKSVQKDESTKNVIAFLETKHQGELELRQRQLALDEERHALDSGLRKRQIAVEEKRVELESKRHQDMMALVLNAMKK